ncbi:MAG: hypothetical protein ABL930_13345, partial [Pseudobdellovibrio sp.]
MEFKQNFSENWIVLFGILLLFVTFYKYNSEFEKIYVKEKNSVKSTIADSSLNRSIASKKNENTLSEEVSAAANFQNSSERFKKALSHKIETTRTPAQNNTKIILADHTLLQY